MSEVSREDPPNVDAGSTVVVEKEDLKDKEGKVMDEAQSLSGVRISRDDNATLSDQEIGTGRGSAHSTPPRSVKSTDNVDASPPSKSSVRPTRRSPRIAARSAPAGVVGSSASPSPKKRVLRVPISAGSGDSGGKHSVTPEALSGKDTPKAGFDMGRRRKQGDTDEVNVNAVARKDEDARDGDEKAPERLLEEEKTGEDPDKGQVECDDKPKQEGDQEEGNDLGVEDSVVAPERLVEEEKTGEGFDKRLKKDDEKQKQAAEDRDQEEGNDLGVEDSVVASKRLVEGSKAEKDPQGEEKGAVGDDEDTVEEKELGEHDDTTDGSETELEEEQKQEEEDDDATDVELEMEEEEKGTGGRGEGTEEWKGLQDEVGGAEEDVMLGDDCIDRGEGDTAQERATKKRESREENDDQEDDVKGKNNNREGKDDNQEEEDDEEGKYDNQEEEDDDEEGKYDNQEEEDDEEGKDYDQEEEEEDDEEVDIDAMIKLASSAVKSQISEPTGGSSGAGVAGGKRPASTAAADGKLRPRKIRRGGAIKSLDSKLSSPKGLLNAESKKKKGKSLSAFVSPKAVEGKVDNLYAESDLYSGRDRATLLKKTKTPKDETAGKGWFNMEQAEMTSELKRDLQVIRMRNYLDPKRFYKSSDKTSKFVQMGTVKEAPGEFFSSRMTKKERKKTLVDELLVADDNFRTYAKNKYKSIQEKNRAGGKAHYKKLSQKRTKSPKWKL